MKNFIKKLLLVVAILFVPALPVLGASIFNVHQGGTGTNSHASNGVIYSQSGTTTPYDSDGDFVRGPNSSFFGVNSTIATGKDVRYAQDANLFGIGIDGVFNAYSDNNFGTSFLGTLAGDFTATGGKDNSMIVGYQSFGPGGSANARYSFDTATTTAEVNIGVQVGSSSVGIEMTADGVLQSMQFRFGGGGSYTMPSTTPNTNDVLTATAPGLLAWVPGGTSSGITIGDPITSGGANRILYENASNDLTESSDFAYDGTIFQVSNAGGVRLLINPVTGRYEIGDVTAVANKNVVSVIDASGLISNQFSSLWQVVDANTAYQYIKVGSGDVNISTFGTGNLIKLGDAGSDGNDNIWELNDFSQQNFIQTGGTFAVQTVAGQRILATDMGGGVGNFEVKAGDVEGVGNNTKITINDAARTIVVTNRFEQSRGDLVTSANNLTLGFDGNVFFIDGSTTINLIERTGWQNGSEVTLMLPGGITLKDNFTPSGSFNPMILEGGTDLITSDDTVIKLLYTNGFWYQSAPAVSQ